MKLTVGFLFILFSFNLSAQVTRSEALDIVLSEIVAPDLLYYHHLYSRYDKMYLNDTLWLDSFLDYYICPFAESWVFFIDDMPVANWAHECRIVLLDADNTEYEIIEENWPPFPFLSEYPDFITQWEWILGTGSSFLQALTENLSIGPNPFQDQIEVNIKSNSPETLVYQLFDLNGRILISGQTENSFKLNTEDLNAGMYILTLSSENTILTSRKLIKTD